MSAEKITNLEEETLIDLKTPKVNEERISGNVDINDLLARIRKEEKRDYKINSIFFGMFIALVLIVGILLSL